MSKLLIFIPSIEDGGVEKNLFLITNYLIEKGLDVSLITANKEKKKFFNKRLNFISANSDYWSYKGRFLKTLFCFYLLLNFYFNNKNFLILSFQANIYAIFFSIILNLKIITRSNTAPGSWSSNIFKRLIFKISFKYPKEIIVNSLDFKKQLDREFNIKSVCIYNPFNKHDVEKKSKIKISFNFFKKDDSFLNIINIGRMTDQKDQMLILKSLNNLKDRIKFRCLILGKGVNYSNLRNFIIHNKLKKHIKLIGFKSNPYPYIKKSNLFILSSRFEGLPNVLLEAQYLNKFIISTDCPTGPKEILLNGKLGSLIKVGNQKQLEERVLYYYKNRDNSKLKNKIQMGKENMKRFDFNFNCYKYYKTIKKYI
tara:strand:- start:1716 stop:2819 length:1104 start_codon:yes stop_codon:yes gene_type:complete